MYVVAFNGSPRKKGNTEVLIRKCLEQIEKEGIETEYIQIGGSGIQPCKACYACRKTLKDHCAIDDPLNDWLKKMARADGIIIGSPTYFWGPTPETKALIDRAGFIARCSLRTGGEPRSMFYRKIGGAIAADRRGGSVHVLQSIQALFFNTQMIVPGSTYWAFGRSLEKGEADKDTEGLYAVEEMGRTMAWLIRNLYESAADRDGQ